MASFNTTMVQMTEMSHRKKTMCQLLSSPSEYASITFWNFFCFIAFVVRHRYFFKHANLLYCVVNKNTIF